MEENKIFWWRVKSIENFQYSVLVTLVTGETREFYKVDIEGFNKFCWLELPLYPEKVLPLIG